MNDRPSFNVNKVGKYAVGPTGITGTSDSATNPKTSSVEFTDGKYNSSDLLFQNIDKLGDTLFRQRIEDVQTPESVNEITESLEEDDVEEVEDNFELLSEEEIANNLEYHINFNKRTAQKVTPTQVQVKSNSYSDDKFCRNCGQKFIPIDNFCGNCGGQRNKAS
jgi:hypothetical protein